MRAGVGAAAAYVCSRDRTSLNSAAFTSPDSRNRTQALRIEPAISKWSVIVIGPDPSPARARRWGGRREPHAFSRRPPGPDPLPQNDASEGRETGPGGLDDIVYSLFSFVLVRHCSCHLD